MTGHQSSMYMILDCFGAGTKVNILRHYCRQGKREVEYVWKYQPTGSQMLWGRSRECIFDPFQVTSARKTENELTFACKSFSMRVALFWALFRAALLSEWAKVVLSLSRGVTAVFTAKITVHYIADSLLQASSVGGFDLIDLLRR